MQYLIINTSSSECTASVFKVQSGEIYEKKSREKNSHSEMLFEVIDEALSAASLTYEEITDVAAIVGPGSFTGLRASLSAVQGLRLASCAHVHGVSLLELQAYSIYRTSEENDRDILSIVSTIQKEPADKAFYQIFSNSLVPVSDFKFCSKSELPQGLYAAAKNGTDPLVFSAKFVGEYLAHKLQHNLPETPLTPIYSRNYN
ncbi:tRNA (adenosine(37)-N6)-threonylcarbamoyltransferase complex dimerization subunit type 1 TsaB [Anaplasma platys]|uniref:tRNA (Adenosine(37)-N6)-threonylcarbamoyltransferase complex dimerization subunit type 1 TsaB n=1 Tax=Anaplasma platys TaxID=949 RepID=A0A858PY67_9RICK|nr:tRNA (adenosine(37)-N6)-threonylcarbamoyltransferase complex dimerization subunit type 1 TsaB [Anaplasma platys]QJC27556.1 tRNA (adenosine(37)-N6)-threonylcarbamoyltransferase complex dimerization subunit type 1 TsaB [Anaplasma platys]